MVVLDFTSPQCRWPRLARQAGSLFFATGFVWCGLAPYLFNIKSTTGSLSFWICGCVCRIIAQAHAWHIDAYDLVSSTVGIIFFGILKFSESHAAEAGMVFGTIQIVILPLYIGNINMVSNSALWDSVHGGITLVVSATCCLLFLTLVVSLERISRTEKDNIGTDAGEMSEVWRRLQQEPNSFSAMHGIELCAEAINVSMSHITESFGVSEVVLPPRHRTCAVLPDAGTAAHRRNAYRKAAVSNQNKPILSLDQLCFQAVQVSPLFRTKVQEWASVGKSFFPAKPASGEEGGGVVPLVSWQEALNDASLRSTIAWPAGRNSQKSVRFYIYCIR